MLEEIRRIESASQFDFRVHANGQDPLRHLFPQWVDYYRTKWSIARWLKPQSILEVGVRYGYSAISFLDACPLASYTGLDNNSNQSGGVPGAIDWAKKITSPYDASFILADTTTLTHFPEGKYDLVHIDGAQFGDSTYHDLELALEVADYILLDGVFWTDVNNLAASSFLKDYQSRIEFAIHLPGYAGELVIRTKQNQTNKLGSSHSSLIQGEYNKSYYLEDCGGFDSYVATGGRVISDSRLNACVTLVDPQQASKVLDVGCGRGEVALACASRGAQVDAIDYSEAAIDISRQTIEQTQESDLITLHCADIANFQRVGAPYDAMVAADFVEHVSPVELESFYAWAHDNLSDEGELIVHTFPNLWFYQYEYARKRRVVAREGGYISLNPRTDYEKQMHINEQSPRVLYRQLKAQFDHVLVWLASNDDPVFSLKNTLGHRAASQCPSIFAIASKAPIDRDVVVAKFSQSALEPSQLINLGIESAVTDVEVAAGDICVVKVSVANKTGVSLSSQPPYPLHLSYHLRAGAQSLVYDGERTKLNGELRDGETAETYMKIQAPSTPGKYQVDLTAVQEQVAWVDQLGAPERATLELTVI